jgi:hypothetical protein
MHWRSDHQTPLAVRDSGLTTTRVWLVMLAALGATLLLAVVLA